MKVDFFSIAHRASITLATSVAVFFVTSGFISELSDHDADAVFAAQFIASCMSITVASGVYCSLIIDNKIDAIVNNNNLSSDSLFEELLDVRTSSESEAEEKKILTFYDYYMLCCIAYSNTCNVIFPMLFAFMQLEANNIYLKTYVKAPLLIASAFFGGLGAVEPVSNIRNTLLSR